jgi:hypothetical protein
VVQVTLTNRRIIYITELIEDDEDWLRATSCRGRSILLRRDRVAAATPVC